MLLCYYYYTLYYYYFIIILRSGIMYYDFIKKTIKLQMNARGILTDDGTM